MRKKKYICLGLFFVATLAILSGCTKPTKGEKEIIEDLQADPAFISENTTISSYEIIKRRTDTDNKQDWVYVNVQSNDLDLTYSLSYELLYELFCKNRQNLVKQRITPHFLTTVHPNYYEFTTRG